MFNEALAFNQDISGWDTSSLTTSKNMFGNTPYQVCTAYANYASACPGGYTNKGVFARCAGAACADSDFLATGSCCAPPPPWQPASDGAFKTALAKCLAETQDGSCPIFAASNDATTGNPYGVMGDWDMSAVTNMDKLFYSYGQFNQDISKWDTGAVTSMSQTFYQALAFNQDLSKWKTGAVTNMYQTFYRAHAFNQDLKTWDTSKVTTMEEMFKEATAFNQDISGWDTSSLITSVDMT
jgi:surface protein